MDDATVETKPNATTPCAKDEVRALLDRLPEDATLEQIQYHLGVYVTLTRRAERDHEPGISDEEMSRRIDSWFVR